MPHPGDMLRLNDPIGLGMDHIVRVVAVYKSLDEDWGCDGEIAWAMYDVIAEENDGKAPEWFAMIQNLDDDTLTSCVMDYEVVELVE